MKRTRSLLASLALLGPGSLIHHAVNADPDPFAGFVNQGLVGVGRIPADSFDRVGPHNDQDTLGGMFSGMCFDPTTLRLTDSKNKGKSYGGTLYALPDRGFGDGLQDYLPRFQEVRIDISPYYGAGPAPQNQVKFKLEDTVLLQYDDVTNFTGFDPDPAATAFPFSFQGGLTFPGITITPASLGDGRPSIDAEGIVKMSDGTFFISDEYGPFIYHVDRKGLLLETLTPPAALMPREGNTFGSRVNDFSASAITDGTTSRPNSGRNDNRGLEGVTVTPDETRLIAVLQSPTIQDSGSGGTQRNTAINTRILYFDIVDGSSTQGKVVEEYVYQLTTTNAGPPDNFRHTPISEILAVNNHILLVIERDGYGRGQIETGRDTVVPLFKKVVLVDTIGATNIAGTGYDQEKDDASAPGALVLPYASLPATVVPVAAADFVDLLDTAQLAKFGMNVKAHASSDVNSIGEKWEGLAIVPLNDPAAADDFLLLVGNDNDFKAATVVHNGQVVGTNAVPLDNMILAWRVTLPGYQPNLTK